jgi:hypothetical protein
MTPWKTALRTAFLPFLLSRLWISIFVYLGHLQHPYLLKVPHAYEGVPNWWLNPWTTYDSLYYLGIAREGYAHSHWSAFFPLYPTLLSLAGNDLVTVAAWGVFLSHLSLLAGLALLYHLTTLDFNQDIANRTIWLTAFFPTAAVFGAVYTESVFLVLLTATFLAARRERWVLAGLIGFVAALTRNSGPVIFVALFVHYIFCLSRDHRRAKALELLAIFVPLTTFFVVQLYFEKALHVDTFETQRTFFKREFGSPLTPLWKDFWLILTLQWTHPMIYLNLGASILSIYFALRYWKQPAVFYSVFLLVLVLLHLTVARTFPSHTVGAARYVLTTIPFLQRLALWQPNVLRYPLFRWCGIAVYLLLCAMFSMMFGMKQFLF